jgi:DGQHR domain-containing protein
MQPEYIKINVILIRQNIGTFYIGKMTPKDLKYISREDISRYENAEKGIQRNISRSRQNSIKKYIDENPDSTFPNTIIVAVESNPAEADDPTYRIKEEGENVYLYLLKKSNIASILDGQHRLSGFDNDNTDFELAVSFFLEPSLSTQAKIFAKINSTQVKVNNDLVYDLYGITDERATQKTAYSIVKHLNEDDDSVWKGGIKTLADRDGYLSQGSFAKYIDLELLSENKAFNKLYLEERDRDILQILKNYFLVVSKEFFDIWGTNDKKIIFQKSTGFVGLMLFLQDIIKISISESSQLDIKYIEKFINGSSKNFKHLISDNYESGAKGQIRIRNNFRESLTQKQLEILGIKI